MRTRRGFLPLHSPQRALHHVDHLHQETFVVPLAVVVQIATQSYGDELFECRVADVPQIQVPSLALIVGWSW